MDAFFFLSGFFLAYATLPRKMSSGVHYVIAILNRYLRLIPAYLVILLFFWQILPYLSSGPMWFVTKYEYSNVCDTLWRNVLMVDNLISVDGVDYCMGVSWYISNDFQLFIFCLLPIAIYKSVNRLYAKLFCGLLIFTNLMITMGYCLYTGAGLFAYNQVPVLDVFNDVYTKFYHRMSPYVMGVMVGFSFHEMKEFLSAPDRKDKTFKQLVDEMEDETKTNPEWPIMARLGYLMEMKEHWYVKYSFYLVGAGLIVFTTMIKYSYITQPEEWTLVA